MKYYIPTIIYQLFSFLSLYIYSYLHLPSGHAQETDITQDSEPDANAGIQKVFTQNKSAKVAETWILQGRHCISLIVTPFALFVEGGIFFKESLPSLKDSDHEPAMAEGISKRMDQLVAGLADSCAACHGRPRGSAGFGGDVFTQTR